MLVRIGARPWRLFELGVRCVTIQGMKNLPIDLNTFPFYEREFSGGKLVRNRCGRDFIYNCLAYYFPKEFGVGMLDARDLERGGYLGVSVPALFAWTQIQFFRLPNYLREKGLVLSINGNRINFFSEFFRSILFSKMSFVNAMVSVEKAIDEGVAVGIDISVGFGGLLDHVLFVYGYDEENLYVFETTQTPIKYESVSQFPHVMKLSKTEVRSRWTRFGRVWIVR